jgi:sulfite exporter TauE/SafE
MATLDVDGAVPWEGVVRALDRVGYSVGRTPWLSSDRQAWLRALGALVAVAGVALVVTRIGFGDVATRVSDGAGGLTVVLLLGLTAGVSTCMALVGGLVLAVSASRAQSSGAAEVGRWRPQLVFQAGRIAGFFVLGACLGAIGARLSLPTPVVAALMLVVALFMILLGLRLTGLFPRLSGVSLSLPASWSSRLGLDDKARGPYSDMRTAALGAATFFLPCGFTQVVELYAMTTAAPLQSGTVMAVFALGTAPGLLAIGGLPNFASGARRAAVLSVAGVALVVFALVNMSSAFALLGITTPRVASVTATGVSPNVTLEKGVQVVRMDETSRGYSPSDTVVYAGVPIRWVITSESQFTCASAMRGVGSDFSLDLTTGENVVELKAMQPGTFAWTCAMGMYGGSLTAVQRPVPASAT